ncbi:hypothetical protein DKX38_006230 [Salix brachista]|uniref:Large ribosomal subunit protein uL2 C-terminal domain-containing protein n=1 Tax=Salix brachista TaxID=2182728 RepID=A0A5N5N3Q6_9ROSI|nr:hypothetical protein DKX38_006230 [Salix brachista]
MSWTPLSSNFKKEMHVITDIIALGAPTLDVHGRYTRYSESYSTRRERRPKEAGSPSLLRYNIGRSNPVLKYSKTEVKEKGPIKMLRTRKKYDPIKGTIHHRSESIEITLGRGGQLARAAGAVAKLIAKEGKSATLKLPSGEVRLISKNCSATVGQVGNAGGHREWPMFQEPMLPSEPTTETMPAADNAALVQNAPAGVAEAANNAPNACGEPPYGTLPRTADSASRVGRPGQAESEIDDVRFILGKGEHGEEGARPDHPSGTLSSTG